MNKPESSADTQWVAYKSNLDHISEDLTWKPSTFLFCAYKCIHFILIKYLIFLDREKKDLKHDIECSCKEKLLQLPPSQDEKQR